MKNLVNIEVGNEVKATQSRCIGIKIDSLTYTGTIKKVNKKSIIVSINHVVHTFGKDVQYDGTYCLEVKFNLWKVVDGRTIYKANRDMFLEF